MAAFTHTRARAADSSIKRLMVNHPLTAYFILMIRVFGMPSSGAVVS
jgi:hypothetical protein